MADLPDDDLERLESIAANLRHRLTKIEARIRRLKEHRRWAVFCRHCGKEWTVPYEHPGGDVCAECAANDVLIVLERLLPQHKTDSMRDQIEAAITLLRATKGHHE